MAHNTRLRKRRVLGVLTLGTLHYDSRIAEAEPSDSKLYRAIMLLDLMALPLRSKITFGSENDIKARDSWILC